MSNAVPNTIPVSKPMEGKRVVIEQVSRLALGQLSDPEVFVRFVMEVAEKANSLRLSGDEHNHYTRDVEWFQMTSRSTENPYMVVIDVLPAHD